LASTLGVKNLKLKIKKCMNKLKKFNKILLAVVFILLAGGFFGVSKAVATTQ